MSFTLERTPSFNDLLGAADGPMEPVFVSPLPSDEAIVSAFRTVDKRIALEYPGHRAGATATVLFLGVNPTDSKTWDLKRLGGRLTVHGKRGKAGLDPFAEIGAYPLPVRLEHHHSPSETIHHPPPCLLTS